MRTFSCRFSACSEESPEEVESNARNREIESILRKEAKQSPKPIKLLILGAGESGKSTVLKQMKLMNGIRYSQREIALFRLAITKNIIECAQTLIHAMDTLKIPFMNDLDRCTNSEYIPTDDDILQARIITTSVTETEIEVNPKFKLRVFDVGGQRTHRNKWAQYFEDVDAIMFIAAYFPSFIEPSNVKSGCKYFKQRMQDINKYPERKIYFYSTFATDKQQMKTILTAVNTALIEYLRNAVGFS
ncbi:guanine nucleotide-binding protein subunit alpha [Podochytrium sp. JEL0797]|nr:guanine nucleotide-binding protein subunit alpha [Podochytrium sp. JEL0797]